jgi:hypothetical protein
MQLRYLRLLVGIGTERNSIDVFPMPNDNIKP